MEEPTVSLREQLVILRKYGPGIAQHRLRDLVISVWSDRILIGEELVPGKIVARVSTAGVWTDEAACD